MRAWIRGPCLSVCRFVQGHPEEGAPVCSHVCFWTPSAAQQGLQNKAFEAAGSGEQQYTRPMLESMFHGRLLLTILPAHNDATKSQSVGLLRAAFPVTRSHHQSASPKSPTTTTVSYHTHPPRAPSRSVVECAQQLLSASTYPKLSK